MIPLRRLPRLLPRRPSSLLGTSLHQRALLPLLQKTSTSATSTAVRHEPPPPPLLPAYAPPKSGFISLLPTPLIPYAELTRLDKPTGTLYLLLPCLWSTLLAATLTTPLAPVSSVLYTSALFTTGAFIMRGAGCSINDLWDRRIDPLITRTRLRPLARGAITTPAAVLFTGAQLLTGLGLLVQFPLPVVVAAIPSLVLVTAYPLMKRITNYPQVILGGAFSWGAILGFPALGLSFEEPGVAVAAACLYASNVAWTVLYDTVYALQDVVDDRKAGVMSTAVRHGGDGVKGFLGVLGGVQVGLLTAAGVAAGAGPVFFVGSVGGTVLGTAYMIRKLNAEDVAGCAAWFRWCAWAIGGVAIGGGLVGEYAVRKWQEEEEAKIEAVLE